MASAYTFHFHTASLRARRYSRGIPDLGRFVATLLLFAFLATNAAAQTNQAKSKPDEATEAYLREHYTKYEYRIPMRDGVHLFTRVYAPKDDSQTWPILLTRTPYALKPYGEDNYNTPSGSFETFATNVFILVTQDVRGRFASEGEYVHVRPFNPNKGPKDTDENSDAWDTIDWLVKNVPNNNGRVGMFGISYPGFYTSMGMIDTHPALKAASPQAPISDWFMGDDLHHNGAFFLSQNFGFFYWFEQKSDDPLRDGGRHFVFHNPDGYDFYLRMGPLANSDTVLFKGGVHAWIEFLAHPDYDAFWQARNIRPHLKNIRCAVMTVGGWFDGEDLFGALETYRSTERQNPGITNLLVMGPWAHGDWGRKDGDKLGDINFQAKTAEYYREHIELPFFRYFLKDDTNYALPEACMFETGTHQWRRFDAWPPRNAREQSLFFHAGGKLDFTPPAQEAGAFDEYVSDPAKPVPFTMEVTTDYPRSYPLQDQRFAASRPDVLVYETEPLEEDLTFAGPLKAALHVATTGTDADWVVKLIDVYAADFPNPDPNPTYVVMGGYQQLVRGDVMRARFRNSFEKPEAMEPGKVTKIEFTMPDVCHTFRRGHRVMVQVQSSWFPLVDRNPQKFVNIHTAKPADFQKATQRVYHSPQADSRLSVQVLGPAR
ncbi:MAG TPA: CocE/NonD family hydrolase [Candidatus Angelobacter sp.]|nr:CocE/NonD family hydrolase [Candidatus Angelobacter sp.]